MVDALGLPLTFEITEGQRHDSKPAKELVARVLSRLRPALAANLSRYASQACASRMSIDTMRTIMSLPDS